MILNPEKFFNGPLLLLVQAALKHNASELKRLIDLGVNINSIGNEGMTPLIFSVMKQDEEAIKMLLQNEADPVLLVPDTGSALLISCRTKNTNSLNTLLDAGVDIKTQINKEPLTFEAARYDNIPTIQILIKRGIPVDARDGSANTLLIESIVMNDLTLAEWLIQQGANVHAINSFLISAAYKLQSRFNETAGKGPNVSKYKHLMQMFEKEGVSFPVPTSLELKKMLHKNFITVEEALNMDELGKMTTNQDEK